MYAKLYNTLPTYNTAAILDAAIRGVYIIICHKISHDLLLMCHVAVLVEIVGS